MKGAKEAFDGPEGTSTPIEPSRAEKGHGEATEIKWEYQLTVFIPVGGDVEPFTYGPYLTEDCAGLLDNLGPNEHYNWRIQRRPALDWVDHRSGVVETFTRTTTQTLED